MTLRLGLLQTRVARRMLGVFLLCGVTPVVVTAAAAYLGLVSELTTVANERLIKDGKTASGLALARLQAMAGRLSDTAALARAGGGAVDSTAGSFHAVVVENADHRLTSLFGSASELPVLDLSQRARLRKGMPLLIMGSGGVRQELWLVITTAARGAEYPRVWGQAHVPDAFAGLEFGPSFTLRDSAGVILSSPGQETAPRLLKPGQVSASSRWNSSSGMMLTGYYRLFLGYSLGASTWVLAINEPEDVALAPLSWLRDIFIYGTVFAVVLIFVLSHVQIRRRMTPLADLTAGTERLRAGDFSNRVSVKSNDEFEILADSFNDMADDIAYQFRALTTLQGLDRVALEANSTSTIALAALECIPALMDAGVVGIGLANTDDRGTWTIAVVRRGETVTAEVTAHLDEAELAELASHSHALTVELARCPLGCVTPFQTSGLSHLTLFPIVHAGHPLAFLAVGRTDAAPLAAKGLAIGRQLADQLALGLSHVSRLEELDALSIGALTALARTIDAASHWTGGHSERVTTCAVELARRMGRSPQELIQLQQAGLLHDVGKIGVPSHILDKPGRLTDEEMTQMQAHPVIGARIVGSIRAFRELVPLVLHHHELLDGSGYPDGLREDQIPELVRILTVADVYDALVSDRPYRRGLTPQESLAILARGSGTKFDSRAVDALRDMVDAAWTPSGGREMFALCAQDQQVLTGVHSEES